MVRSGVTISYHEILKLNTHKNTHKNGGEAWLDKSAPICYKCCT
jgi:hypothetical protein